MSADDDLGDIIGLVDQGSQASVVGSVGHIDDILHSVDVAGQPGTNFVFRSSLLMQHMRNRKEIKFWKNQVGVVPERAQRQIDEYNSSVAVRHADVIALRQRRKDTVRGIQRYSSAMSSHYPMQFK
jgi:hypothetical protein